MLTQMPFEHDAACHFPLGDTPPTGYDQLTMSKNPSGSKDPSGPRGGKRPGAGAPFGNLNALKTGEHSKQLLALTEFLLASDAFRAMVLKMHEEKRRGGRTLQDASNKMARRILKKRQSNNAAPDRFEEPFKPIEF
jgi:hypothetical protein